MEFIIKKITEEFEVSKKEAECDMKELFDHLMDINAIERVD